LVAIPLKYRDSDNNAKTYRYILKEQAENLLMDLDAMRQKINNDALSFFALNFGKYVGGATL
jgi:hypothetical protein